MHNEGKRTQSIICLVVTACFLLSLAGTLGVVKVTSQVWPLTFLVPVIFGLFVSLFACLIMRFVIRKLKTIIFMVALAVVFTAATSVSLVWIISLGGFAY